MLNKVKEMGSTIGKKVVEDKKQIAIVAGGAVVLVLYGVFVYKNIELCSFRDGSQVLGVRDWVIISKGIIDREAIMDAMINNH